MTTMTLATIESRPLRPLRPLRPVPQARWLVHDLSTPTTTPGTDAVAAIERAHAALVLARLVVVAFLGAAAMVAGAVVGRL